MKGFICLFRIGCIVARFLDQGDSSYCDNCIVVAIEIDLIFDCSFVSSSLY